MQEASEPKFAPVGQIANLLDGLTPSFRKRKRKVRRGRALRAHDFSEPPAPAKKKAIRFREWLFSCDTTTK